MKYGSCKSNKMKGHFAILPIVVFTIMFLSCNNTNSSGSDQHSNAANADSIPPLEMRADSLDGIVQNLLDEATKDFNTHQPPVPLDFRDVKFKFLTNSNGEKTYLLCGQFLHEEDLSKVWTYFVTIKTDPYEQWIGSNASTYCQDSKEIAYTKSDLAIALTSRYDSLQELAK